MLIGIGIFILLLACAMYVFNLAEVDGYINTPSFDKLENPIIEKPLIFYYQTPVDNNLGEIAYVWNPLNKTIHFADYNGNHKHLISHDNYLHWQIYNTSQSMHLYYENSTSGVKGIGTLTFFLFNYWYDDKLEQDKQINLLQNQIEELQDKLGKQAKRLKALEAQIAG